MPPSVRNTSNSQFPKHAQRSKPAPRFDQALSMARAFRGLSMAGTRRLISGFHWESFHMSKSASTFGFRNGTLCSKLGFDTQRIYIGCGRPRACRLPSGHSAPAVSFEVGEGARRREEGMSSSKLQYDGLPVCRCLPCSPVVNVGDRTCDFYSLLTCRYLGASLLWPLDPWSDIVTQAS